MDASAHWLKDCRAERLKGWPESPKAPALATKGRRLDTLAPALETKAPNQEMKTSARHRQNKNQEQPDATAATRTFVVCCLSFCCLLFVVCRY